MKHFRRRHGHVKAAQLLGEDDFVRQVREHIPDAEITIEQWPDAGRICKVTTPVSMTVVKPGQFLVVELGDAGAPFSMRAYSPEHFAQTFAAVEQLTVEQVG